MRVLSPTSNASTPRYDTPTTTNEGPKTMSAKSSGIAQAAGASVPMVTLDTDVVSNNMAARLCISFLGHVLFLKNQIPFPIVQLARMPTSDDTTRAIKKRHELLNSFDTLASHLYTTFIALSTALALRGIPEKQKVDSSVVHREPGAARAFFAVVLGPTVGTAKSRMIVGIDSLETKVWGLREDEKEAVRIVDIAADDDNDDSPSEDESDTDEQGEESEDEQTSEEENVPESDDDAPPPSRSPSPTPSDDSDDSPSTSPRNVSSKTHSQQTEDPESVRAAERLLSRTLASACAEDDGHGLASEMAPTQIYVLLRAPRRFDHPSWIPRQNLCPSLDSYLADFLVESGETPLCRDTTSTAKKPSKANKVQGIWIKSRGDSTLAIASSEEGLAEEDEMIWWCWDGRLVGFSDW